MNYISTRYQKPDSSELRIIDEYKLFLADNKEINRSLIRGIEAEYSYKDYGPKEIMLEGIEVVRPSDVEKLRRQKLLDTELILEGLELFLGEDLYRAYLEIMEAFITNPNSPEGAVVQFWASFVFGTEILYFFDDGAFGYKGDKLGLDKRTWEKLSSSPEYVYTTIERYVQAIKENYKVDLLELLSKVYAFTQHYIELKGESDRSQQITKAYSYLEEAYPTKVEVNNNPVELLLASKIDFEDGRNLYEISISPIGILAVEEMLPITQRIFYKNRFGVSSLLYINPENFKVLTPTTPDKVVQDFQFDKTKILDFCSYQFLHQYLSPAMDNIDFDTSYTSISRVLRPEFSNLITANVTSEKISRRMRLYAYIYNVKQILASQDVEEGLVSTIVDYLLKNPEREAESPEYVQSVFGVDLDQAKLILDAIVTASDKFPNFTSEDNFQLDNLLTPEELAVKIKKSPYSNKFITNKELVDIDSYQISVDPEEYQVIRNKIYEIIFKETNLSDIDILCLYTFQKLFAPKGTVEVSQFELDNLLTRFKIVPKYRALCFSGLFIFLPQLDFSRLFFLEELNERQYKSFSLLSYQDVQGDPKLLNNILQHLTKLKKDYFSIAKLPEYSKYLTSHFENSETMLPSNYVEINKVRIPLSQIQEVINSGKVNALIYEVSPLSAEKRYEYISYIYDVLIKLYEAVITSNAIFLSDLEVMSNFYIKNGEMRLPYLFNHDLEDFVNPVIGDTFIYPIPILNDVSALPEFNINRINSIIRVNARPKAGMNLSLYLNQYIPEDTTSLEYEAIHCLKDWLNISNSSITKSTEGVLSNYRTYLISVKSELSNTKNGELAYDQSKTSLIRVLHLMKCLLKGKYRKININQYTTTKGVSSTISYAKMITSINYTIDQLNSLLLDSSISVNILLLRNLKKLLNSLGIPVAKISFYGEYGFYVE